MNIEEKIERDKQKYSHVKSPRGSPIVRIRSAYQSYLRSAKLYSYKLDFTLEELIHYLYSLGYSELYVRWRDSGVKSKHQPKILQRRTEKITLDNIFITTQHEMEEDYKRGLKRCTICDTKKSLDSFTKARHRLFNLYPSCRECELERSRTIEGLLTTIYKTQRSSSRHRKHPMPDYTRQELTSWLYENGLEALYKDWAVSGYEKDLRPSTDRLDSLKPYAFDNLELVTWEENRRRGHEDTKNGIGAGAKQCKPVYQYTLEGDFVAEYHSQAEAERVTGTPQANIFKVVTDERRAASGFIWRCDEVVSDRRYVKHGV